MNELAQLRESWLFSWVSSCLSLLRFCNLCTGFQLKDSWLFWQVCNFCYGNAPFHNVTADLDRCAGNVIFAGVHKAGASSGHQLIFHTSAC